MRHHSTHCTACAAQAPKLLRLGRIFKLLSKIDGAGDAIRICLLLVSLMFIVHFLACGFFALIDADGRQWLLDSDRGYTADSPLLSQYLTVYMTTMLMFNGDGVSPTTDAQTAYVIVVVLIGSCVNAALFANVARLTGQMSERRHTHERKVDTIATAMRKLKVDAPLANRVMAFYEYHAQSRT